MLLLKESLATQDQEAFRAVVRLRSLRGFNSPAFPQVTSRRRCGRPQSCLPRAPGKSVKGREVRRAGGRSIPDCPGLYRPLSSSLPRALGLRAWLLGGSGARWRPLRLPGRLKSGLAGGKRCRGCGLVGRGRRAGVGLGPGRRPGGAGPGAAEAPGPAGSGCTPHGGSLPCRPRRRDHGLQIRPAAHRCIHPRR